MPRRTRKDQLNNLILAALNIIILVLAGLLLEYEIARARRPDLGWIPTPSEVDYAIAGIITVGALIVLAILALIYKKDLYNRPYLWWITGFNVVVGLATLAINIRAVGFVPFIHFVLFP